MSVSIRSGATDGAIQVNGLDAVPFNASGLTSGPSIAAAVAAYFQPINNTGTASDLTLGVLQTAYVTASAATSIPLHIACGDGQIYEMSINGNYTTAASASDPILQANNTAPANNNFNIRGFNVTGTVFSSVNGNYATNGFDLSFSGSSIVGGKYEISTSTKNKSVNVINAGGGNSTNSFINSNGLHFWIDTTTLYLSLGTIILPNAWTGTITVRRVA